MLKDMKTQTKHAANSFSLVTMALIMMGPSLGRAAQQEQPVAPAPAPAPAPSDAPAPAEATPATGDAVSPPSAPEKSTEERITHIESQIEGINEPFSVIQSDVAALKKLKISGYLQGRYEWHDDASFGVNPAASNAPLNTNRFSVRRGRLKATYAGNMSEYLLQIDATGGGVDLKDAEASFVLNNENAWFPGSTPWELKLSMGQMKVPFGYEVLQSSGERDFLERTAVVRALFPGERDRGFRVLYSWDWLRFAGAVMNGNFTNDAIYKTSDQTSWKDLVGRLGGDFEFMTAGVSAYSGHNLATTLRPAMGMTPASASYTRFGRTRLGADAQLYFDVPSLGGFALKGEIIWAKDKQMSFSGVEPDADQCKDVESLGWYVQAIQNIGEHAAVALRFDQYDPNTGVKDACDMAARAKFEKDRVRALELALIGYVSGNLKTSFHYNHPLEQGTTVGNDYVTVQMQAKF